MVGFTNWDPSSWFSSNPNDYCQSPRSCCFQAQILNRRPRNQGLTDSFNPRVFVSGLRYSNMQLSSTCGGWILPDT